MASNGDFSFANGGGSETIPAGGQVAGKILPKIQTHPKRENGICHDDSAPPVKAQTIDQLHSLQKKKSAPTTPITGAHGAFASPTLSEEERHKQQLQSIRLASTISDHIRVTVTSETRFLSSPFGTLSRTPHLGPPVPFPVLVLHANPAAPT